MRRGYDDQSVALALRTNELSTVFRALLAGSTLTEADVLYAVRNCEVNIVTLVLNQCDCALARFDKGFTLLHEVAAADKPDLIPAVIAAIDEVQHAWGGKRAVSVVDNHRRTALHAAGEAGSVGCIETLLAAGANLEARDKDNNTPLLWCTASDNFKNVRAALCLIRKVRVFLLVVAQNEWDNLLMCATRERMSMQPIL